MEISECCDAKIILTDICSNCKEHTTEAADYKTEPEDEHTEKYIKEQGRRGNMTGDAK